MAGSVTEVSYSATIPRPGPARRVDGSARIKIPGTARLKVTAPGYRPETLSPFLDNPRLVEFITGLNDQDLLRWETFERVRALMSDVKLTFRLKREK